MSDFIEAAKNGDLYKLRDLVVRCAVDINHRAPPNGASALYWAACNDHVTTCEFLIRYGADVYLADNSGSTPLHAAADRGHVRCVKLLMRNFGGRINEQTTSNGDTPLHLAAYRGHVDVCRVLLEGGAYPLLLNNTGRTAFEEALSKNHYETCQLLRQHEERLRDTSLSSTVSPAHQLGRHETGGAIRRTHQNNAQNLSDDRRPRTHYDPSQTFPAGHDVTNTTSQRQTGPGGVQPIDALQGNACQCSQQSKFTGTSQTVFERSSSISCGVRVEQPVRIPTTLPQPLGGYSQTLSVDGLTPTNEQHSQVLAAQTTTTASKSHTEQLHRSKELNAHERPSKMITSSLFDTTRTTESIDDLRGTNKTRNTGCMNTFRQLAASSEEVRTINAGQRLEQSSTSNSTMPIDEAHHHHHQVPHAEASADGLDVSMDARLQTIKYPPTTTVCELSTGYQLRTQRNLTNEQPVSSAHAAVVRNQLKLTNCCQLPTNQSSDQRDVVNDRNSMRNSASTAQTALNSSYNTTVRPTESQDAIETEQVKAPSETERKCSATATSKSQDSLLPAPCPATRATETGVCDRCQKQTGAIRVLVQKVAQLENYAERLQVELTVRDDKLERLASNNATLARELETRPREILLPSEEPPRSGDGRHVERIAVLEQELHGYRNQCAVLKHNYGVLLSALARLGQLPRGDNSEQTCGLESNIEPFGR